MQKFIVYFILLLNAGIANSQYRKHHEVLQTFNEIVQANPNTSILKYGMSDGNFDLFAFKWNPSGKANLPRILITSTTHGDEWITAESLTRTVEVWFSSATRNPDFFRALENYEIWIIPIVSPDAHALRSRTVAGGIDPNRSFPSPGSGITTSSVQVIQRLVAFAHSLKPIGVVDLHAFGEYVLLPWAHTFDPLPTIDLNNYRILGEKLFEATGYRSIRLTDFLGRTATGGALDFWYGNFGSYSIGVEVGTSKVPPAPAIPAIQSTVQRLLETYVITLSQF